MSELREEYKELIKEELEHKSPSEIAKNLLDTFICSDVKKAICLDKLYLLKEEIEADIREKTRFEVKEFLKTLPLQDFDEEGIEHIKNSLELALDRISRYYSSFDFGRAQFKKTLSFSVNVREEIVQEADRAKENFKRFLEKNLDSEIPFHRLALCLFDEDLSGFGFDLLSGSDDVSPRVSRHRLLEDEILGWMGLSFTERDACINEVMPVILGSFQKEAEGFGASACYDIGREVCRSVVEECQIFSYTSDTRVVQSVILDLKGNVYLLDYNLKDYRSFFRVVTKKDTKPEFKLLSFEKKSSKPKAGA